MATLEFPTLALAPDSRDYPSARIRATGIAIIAGGSAVAVIAGLYAQSSATNAGLYAALAGLVTAIGAVMVPMLKMVLDSRNQASKLAELAVRLDEAHENQRRLMELMIENTRVTKSGAAATVQAVQNGADEIKRAVTGGGV